MPEMLPGIRENSEEGGIDDGSAVLSLHPLATNVKRVIMTIAICFILSGKVGEIRSKEGIFVPFFWVVADIVGDVVVGSFGADDVLPVIAL